jgi:putative membrane protein
VEEAMAESDPEPEQITEARRLVYFAAERTLMAWVRTALGLMALGFVIDRFGLVLREIAPQFDVHFHSQNFSFWAGTALVTVGAVMALVAALRYWHFGFEYRYEHATRPGHGILLGVAFTLIIAIAGFVIAAFLFSFHNP